MTAPSGDPAAVEATISVIIVNFDGRHHLEQCLPALVSQTRAAEQVIVVDNGSSDGSVDFVRSCFPEVTTIALEENRGFAGGNLSGYEAARGDYIVLLNNDTRPEPDWLERLAACADSLPDVGILASHMTDWKGNRTDTAGDGCTVTGRGFKLMQGRSTSEPLSSGYVFSACAGAALYKRIMLDDVGFFEESFYMNAEDTDLAFRAQLAGWKAYLCAAAKVRHRIGGSQKIYSSKHVYYSTRNHIWLLFRCMPRRLLVKHAAATLLQSLLYLAHFARQGRLRAHLEGWAAGVRGLPQVLRARRAIQSSRRISVRELEIRLTPLTGFIGEKLQPGAVFRRRP